MAEEEIEWGPESGRKTSPWAWSGGSNELSLGTKDIMLPYMYFSAALAYLTPRCATHGEWEVRKWKSL